MCRLDDVQLMFPHAQPLGGLGGDLTGHGLEQLGRHLDQTLAEGSGCCERRDEGAGDSKEALEVLPSTGVILEMEDAVKPQVRPRKRVAKRLTRVLLLLCAACQQPAACHRS
eukprot:765660-Hanusia_phi.AAC.7